MQVREYTKQDLPDMIRIWNEVVEDGIATLITSHSTIFQSSGASYWSNLTGNPEYNED